MHTIKNRLLHALLLLFLMLIGPLSAMAGVLEFPEMSAAASLQGKPQAEPRQIKLPYFWDQVYPKEAGSVDFRFSFDMAGHPDQPHALYLERIGNRYAIWLNGELIEDRITGASKRADFVKAPRFAIIPAALLRSRNELHIRIDADPDRHAALFAPKFGLQAELEPVYLSAYRMQVWSTLALVIGAAFTSLATLLIWYRQRDRLLLYFTGAVICWGLKLSGPLYDILPVDHKHWLMVITVSYVTYVSLCARFGFEILGIEHSRIARFLNGLYWPLAVAVVVILWIESTPLYHVWRIGMLVLTIGGLGVIIVTSLKMRTRQSILLASAFLVSVAAGTTDYILARLAGSTYSNAVFARYGSFLVIFFFIWLLAGRYVAAQNAARQSREKLEERLAEQEKELAAIYAQQARDAQEKATLEERKRITRDLHDGLGMQITTVMHLAENAQTSRTTIAQQLRDTLDHLRLTVDAMENFGDDLGTVLGNVRFRLTPRIEAAGINLKWKVDPLPKLQGLTPTRVRHFQFILFEAISNCLHHASATTLEISAGPDESGKRIVISIRDDGTGFDTESGKAGRGLRNLKTRADSLDAELAIASSRSPENHGTTITLVLEKSAARLHNHPPAIA